jgi:hypothetical protein
MSDPSPLNERNFESAPVDKGASALDQTISVELLRARIREVSKELEHPQSGLEKLSKNPLVGIVVGFLLTWGIGTILTNNYKEAREASERKTQIAERNAREASEKDKQTAEKRRELNIRGVDELSRIIYDRRTATMMLSSSLLRNAPLAERNGRLTMTLLS